MKISLEQFIKDTCLFESAKKRRKQQLIILVGIPGSGKTTLSEVLRKEEGYVVISTDSIKRFMIKHHANFRITDMFETQGALMRLALSNGYSVIADSNSDKEQYRKRLHEFASESSAEVITIYLTIPAQVAIERVVKRKMTTDRKRIQKLIASHMRSLEPPEKCEHINSDIPYEQFVAEIERMRRRLV
jgi:predicted kinase